jgi:hypothetical protein
MSACRNSKADDVFTHVAGGQGGRRNLEISKTESFGATLGAREGRKTNERAELQSEVVEMH